MKYRSFTPGLLTMVFLLTACQKHDGHPSPKPQALEWSKTFSATGSCWFQSVTKTSDGGYIAAGQTGVAAGDILVIKVNAAGDKQWSHQYGGSQSELVSSVVATNDGGCVISGTTLSEDGDFKDTKLHSAGSRDVFLMKLRSNGDMSWVRSYGGTGGDVIAPHATVQTADGGFLLGGSTYVHDGDFAEAVKEPGEDPNFFILKTDGGGNITSVRLVGGSGTGFITGLTPTPDGGLLLGGQYEGPADQGFTGATPIGQSDNFVIKLDASHRVVWAKLYGGIDEDLVFEALPTTDGGMVLSGQDSAGNISVRKVNNAGNVQWHSKFGGSEDAYAYSIVQTSKGYALCGFTASGDGDFANTGSRAGTDAFILTLDQVGHKQSLRTWGDAGTDHGSDVAVSTDGSLVFAGSTQPGLNADGSNPLISAWISCHVFP